MHRNVIRAKNAAAIASSTLKDMTMRREAGVLSTVSRGIC
jgi:hypothetical protein